MSNQQYHLIKRKLKSFLPHIVLCFFCLNSFAQSPIIGNYHIYFGSLHNHSNYSADAKGKPDSAYIFAKNTSKLDFLGLSEHCIYLTESNWDSLKIAAKSATKDSVFTAFYGFEWSSSSNFGHISIFNTDSFTTVLKSSTSTFLQICNWIELHNGIAFFNHPGRENSNGTEFMHFETAPINNIVGMELWNKANGFSVYYQNDGYFNNDTNKGFFDEALRRGWRIGASGSEDNHWATWGQYSNYRLAILAKANTHKDLTEALLHRRFYSTLDKNLALSFKIDSSVMGDSIFEGKHLLQIKAFDVDSELFTKFVLIKNGDTSQIWQTNSKNISIDDSINCKKGEYYYIIASQEDGDQAISSPIFIGNKKPQIIDTVKTNIKIGIDNIHISPNPFNEYITISNPESEEITIKIISSTGNVIYNSENIIDKAIKIVTSDYPIGIYFISIIRKENSTTYKLVK